MTALGAGVSDREPFTIFNNPPRPMSREEYNYRESLHKCAEMWHKQRDMLDNGCSQDEINEFTELCVEQDKRRGLLYRCWQENHPHSFEIGGTRFVDGDVVDNVKTVCPDCGMVVHYKSHGLPCEDIPI